MSERRSIPSRVPNTAELRSKLNNRSNRSSEPVTTRVNIKPLILEVRPGGENGSSQQLYSLWAVNPITGGEVEITTIPI